MGVGVGEGTKTIVVLLAGGIPKCELDVLSVDLYIGDVVLEDSGDVNLKRRLTHASKVCGAIICWLRLLGRYAWSRGRCRC